MHPHHISPASGGKFSIMFSNQWGRGKNCIGMREQPSHHILAIASCRDETEDAVRRFAAARK